MSENTNWLELYYHEENPQKRIQLLEEHLNDYSSADQKRLLDLYHQRYSEEGYDLFLRAFLDLTVSKADAGFLVRRSTLKFVEKDMKMLLLKEDADELLKKEWYHLARFYISLCMKDTRFSTSAFGLSHLKEEQIKNKIAAQIHHATRLVPQQFDLQKDFDLLNQQFYLAFCDAFEDGKEIWENNPD